MKEICSSAMAPELKEATDKMESKTFYDSLKKLYGPCKSGATPVLICDYF